MNRWIKVGVIAVATLAVLAAGAVGLGLELGKRRQQAHFEVAVQPVTLRTEAQGLARGKYLFNSRGCMECHGANGAGRMFVDDGKGVKIAGPHISAGPGSLTAAYQPADWVRSIRHGVNPQGRALRVMPSEDYNRFSDEDLGALISYVQSLPPVPGGGPVLEFPLPVRVLYGFGAIPDAAEKIDHKLPPSKPVASAVSVEHGAYVANMCLGCHGEHLSGGKISGGPPDWPAAANLTPGPGSAMLRYPDAQALIALFRSGKRADGSAVAVMPFETLGQIDDTDMQALHMYLRTVPPRPAGEH